MFNIFRILILLPGTLNPNLLSSLYQIIVRPKCQGSKHTGCSCEKLAILTCMIRSDLQLPLTVFIVVQIIIGIDFPTQKT